MGNPVNMRSNIMKKIGLVLLAVLLFGFVLAGCDDGDGNKDKEDDKPKETGFTVTVSGIPPMSGGKIYGASLMASAAPDTPVAIGTLEKGVFTFYNAANTTSDIPLPDTNNPFTTAGDYMLFIAVTDISGYPNIVVDAYYVYTKNMQPGIITFSDTNKNVTLAWSDFQQAPSQP